MYRLFHVGTELLLSCVCRIIILSLLRSLGIAFWLKRLHTSCHQVATSSLGLSCTSITMFETQQCASPLLECAWVRTWDSYTHIPRTDSGLGWYYWLNKTYKYNLAVILAQQACKQLFGATYLCFYWVLFISWTQSVPHQNRNMSMWSQFYNVSSNTLMYICAHHVFMLIVSKTSFFLKEWGGIFISFVFFCVLKLSTMIKQNSNNYCT